MMHAQGVAVAPGPPGEATFIQTGRGTRNDPYVNTVTWLDSSRNETAFVVERRPLGGGEWTRIATVPSSGLGVVPFVDSGDGPGTGERTYEDRLNGRDETTYEYQVYAINTVGDVWDYADPALNNITQGGFPTVTVDSRGDSVAALSMSADLTATSAVKNKKTARVTLTWSDVAGETGYLIQRSSSPSFLTTTNEGVGADVTTLTQSVARGTTYYYRALAFDDTQQSGWSNVATVTTQ